MNSQHQRVRERRADKLRLEENPEIKGLTNIRVLLLRTREVEDDIYQIFFEGLRSRVFINGDCQELWLLPSDEPFHLAILHHTLSDLDLEVASRIIRQRWAQTRILLIRADVEFLDDTLYDERLVPPVGVGTLLRITRQLLRMCLSNDRMQYWRTMGAIGIWSSVFSRASSQ